MRTLAALLVGGLCLNGLISCSLDPRTYVALMVDNHSADTGEPDSAQLRVYCDGVLVMDSTMGNVFSYPRNAEAFYPFWLAVVPGPHQLRVLAVRHGVPGLVKDTVLALDTLSFTNITLLRSLLGSDTLRYVDQTGHPGYAIMPRDTTSKLIISKVPYTDVPYRHRPPARLR